MYTTNHGGTRKQVMAKEQEIQPAGTTLNVSRTFAAYVVAIAKDRGITAREFCDRELAPKLKLRAQAAMKRKLASIDLGGEA